MPKKEYSEKSLFWKGLILGLLIGMMGDIVVSFVMKIYDYFDFPIWVWVASLIIALPLLVRLVWFMWKESEK